MKINEVYSFLNSRGIDDSYDYCTKANNLRLGKCTEKLDNIEKERKQT